jgi:phospholipid transport system substrate-binding protein
MQTSFGRRRGLLTVAAALVALTARPAPAMETQAVVAPIQQLIDGLLRIMKAGNGTPFTQRFDMLAPVVDEAFDLNAILQESIGPGAWGLLPSDQKQMLAQAFRRYTVASYVNSFNGYNGEQFLVKSAPRPVAAGEQIVETTIVPVSGDGHELDYVMRQVPTGWRAVDILADGAVSRVAVQRSDFRRLLTRGGAQALADSLRSKSMDLSDGPS